MTDIIDALMLNKYHKTIVFSISDIFVYYNIKQQTNGFKQNRRRLLFQMASKDTSGYVVDVKIVDVEKRKNNGPKYYVCSNKYAMRKYSLIFRSTF